MGGSPPFTANTEEWNGTSWTETNNLNTQRAFGASAGTSTSARFNGGYDGGPNTYYDITEEWTSPTQTTVTFTVS